MTAQTHFINVSLFFPVTILLPILSAEIWKTSSAIRKISEQVIQRLIARTRPFAYGLTLREEGQVEFLAEMPNGLSTRTILPDADGRCHYYLGELANPIAQNSAGPSLFWLAVVSPLLGVLLAHARLRDFLSIWKKP